MLAGKIGYFRATGFDPRSISGLTLWFDANDASTLTVQGGSVSEWRSRVGTGLVATQATAGSRPAYQSSAVNGKPAVFFDGTDDQLNTNYNASALSNYVSYAGVAVAASSMQTNNNYPPLLFARNASPTGLHTQPSSPTTRWAMSWRNTGWNFNIGTFVTTAAQVVLSSVSATAMTVRVNGAQGRNAGTYVAASGEDALFQIGRDSTFGRFWNGHIAELLMFNRPLLPTELVAVERYLADKWGVTLPPQVSNADAQDWISRVYFNGGTVSTTTANAVNQFCVDIENAGIRDRFYRLNLFCGTGLAAALVPLYRGQSLGGTQWGNSTDTNANFVSGDYTETGTSGGLGTGATNSTKTLDTGLVPFNAGITHDNSHMACYSRQGNTTAGAVMSSGLGGTSGTELWQYYLNGVSGSIGQFYRSGGNSNSGMEGPAALRTGHLIARRSGASAAIIRNGTNLSLTATTTNATTWATDRPRAMRVFARRFINNGVETTDQHIATTLQAYSMGLSMTDAQALAYYNAIQAFQTALGRQL